MSAMKSSKGQDLRTNQNSLQTTYLKRKIEKLCLERKN